MAACKKPRHASKVLRRICRPHNGGSGEKGLLIESYYCTTCLLLNSYLLYRLIVFIPLL